MATYSGCDGLQANTPAPAWPVFSWRKVAGVGRGRASGAWRRHETPSTGIAYLIAQQQSVTEMTLSHYFLLAGASRYGTATIIFPLIIYSVWCHPRFLFRPGAEKPRHTSATTGLRPIAHSISFYMHTAV